MNPPIDAELVKQARAGDKDAMGQLLQRHEAAALAVVTRRGLERSLALDLVQEAMVQAWLSLDRLQDPDKFRPWFCGIALNLSRNYLRRRRTAHTSLESMLGGVSGAAVAGSSGLDPAAHVERRELEGAIVDAVGKLPETGRRATQLYYFEQLSIREVAERLGLSESAVKSRLFKARRHLRRTLSPRQQELVVPRHGSVGEITVQEEDKMIAVSVADVVGTLEDEYMVVVLHDAGEERILPIWVGSYEAQAIAMGVREQPTVRPMTFNLMASLLEKSGVELVDVRVDALRESTFYGVVRVRHGDTVEEVDARPSDALALAQRAGCPIYVSSELMEQASSPVPAAQQGDGWQGRGIARIIDESPMARHRAEAEEEPDMSVEEKERKAREALLEQLFGGAQ